jgi:A-factor type gamma-butyrolactone 1'-reductase (1S-forming)
MGTVEGKSIIITGGSGGIGGESAKLFASVGAAVAIADVDDEAGNALVAEIQSDGGRAEFVHCDVTDRASVAELVATAVRTFGGLYGALNAAGVSGPLHPLVGYPDEWFERVLDINVRGMWYSLQEEIPAILAAGGGSIVNMSSGLGTVAAPGMPAYVMSKHAVLGMTRSSALEHATDGLRVNALLPGVVETSMPVNLTADAPEVMDIFRAGHPMGRLGTPREIADAALWLLSDTSSFVTGHGLAIDGGFLAQ